MRLISSKTNGESLGPDDISGGIGKYLKMDNMMARAGYTEVLHFFSNASLARQGCMIDESEENDEDTINQTQTY